MTNMTNPHVSPSTPAQAKSQAAFIAGFPIELDAASKAL